MEFAPKATVKAITAASRFTLHSQVRDPEYRIKDPGYLAINLESMKDLADTICALSTPPGRSGIAVVRMSGPESLDFYRQVFKPKRGIGETQPRFSVLGRIVDPRSGIEIDEAVVSCFPSPNSYTREDMVEFSIHGSPVLISALLDCLCSLGARLAEPGEFTMRAFLHGRIDLTQAEAVNDIINATTLYQAQVAGRQSSGALARKLSTTKELLVEIIVHIESAVEFYEEDLALEPREVVIEHIAQLRRQLMDWVDSYRKGRVIREGFSMAVVGRPNVGKSSVFNALLNQDRSIVTEIPGTTRDLVSEFTNLEGIPVRLLDTAGIHASEDHIERLGIDRSLQAIAEADAILFVGNRNQPLSQQDMELRRQLEHLSCIAVINKCDLPSVWTAGERKEFIGAWPNAEVSAKTGSGIARLRRAILDGIIGAGRVTGEGILITNLRHCQNLEAAERYLGQAATALNEGLSEEFALVDLHKGLQELGAIMGEVHRDDLLTEIFSRFCVGK
jgi:tRNA modification GTPase